jgi:hypothetical protein
MESVMATPPDQRRAPARPPQAPVPGPPRTPPLPPHKPAGPLLQQRSLAALMLALISLIGLLLVSDNVHRGIVVLGVTLVIGGAGLWMALTAMSRSKKAGTARPRLSVLATVLGVAGAGISAIALLVFALFWTQISQYSKCMAGANTVIAQSACKQQLTNALPTHVRLPSR